LEVTDGQDADPNGRRQAGFHDGRRDLSRAATIGDLDRQETHEHCDGSTRAAQVRLQWLHHSSAETRHLGAETRHTQRTNLCN